MLSYHIATIVYIQKAEVFLITASLLLDSHTTLFDLMYYRFPLNQAPLFILSLVNVLWVNILHQSLSHESNREGNEMIIMPVFLKFV